MKNFLIGFLGYAQVGKDTAAIELGWPRAAFADELKADRRTSSNVGGGKR